jgi:hypothetical protein
MTFDKPETSENGLTGGYAWGRRPVPLLPSAIADRLADVELPQWVAVLLGVAEATAKDLTAEAWVTLPANEKELDRVRKVAIDLVTENLASLQDVVIGLDLPTTLRELDLAGWPRRSANALLRSDAGKDRERLAALTFGDVLDMSNVGLQTAVEIAALLETVVQTPNEAAAPSPDGGETIRWGRPETALLPQTLRRAFADEALPEWVLRDLNLPDGATALALDASIWRRVKSIPARVEQYVLGLITYRLDEISSLPVLDNSWRSNLSPTQAPWPVRVFNALTRADLLDASRLSQTTYGELFAIPAMGVKSVLDLAVIAESLAGPPARVLDEAVRLELTTAAEEEWAERVRADDPRFRDVAPPFPGPLARLFDEAVTNPEGQRAEVIASSLPHIRARVTEVAAEPIDQALGRMLKSFGAPERHIDMVVARLGWSGSGPQTLQQVADTYGITRERIRQVTSRWVPRLEQTYLPQLEKAVQVLSDCAPESADRAMHILVEEKLSTVPVHPSSVKGLAEAVGYDVPFRVDRVDGVEYVLDEQLTGTRQVLMVARREAGRVGVSNIEEIHVGLEALDEGFPVEVVDKILRGSPKIEFFDDDWFWMPDIVGDRNRLRNVSRRMLSVSPRLDITTARQGVRRRYKFMQIDLVPPSNILRAFYEAHPEFVLNDDDTVSSSEPLDYRTELGDVERAFVEAFRESPTGLLDRAELQHTVTDRGMNPSTFSVMTSYSPIIDHPATNVWCLRGHEVDAAQVEALRAVLATRPRRRRTVAHGWDDDGRLWLTVSVPNPSSPVVGIPATIARYVAGRRFPARAHDGTPAGVIGVDENGASWGYGPFLRRRGAEPDDALTMHFDLATEEVTLSMDDDASLFEDDID